MKIVVPVEHSVMFPSWGIGVTDGVPLVARAPLAPGPMRAAPASPATTSHESGRAIRDL